MPSGITQQMINFSREKKWGSPDPEPKKDRDRSLAGKARIKARKAAQRAS
jgi:hypothetical protein